GNGDGNSYAYTDSYGNCYAHADSYAHVDAYDPAETKPDAEAISDTAAAPIGATRKRLCGNSRENLASSPRGEGGLMICSGRRVGLRAEGRKCGVRARPVSFS